MWSVSTTGEKRPCNPRAATGSDGAADRSQRPYSHNLLYIITE
jgi:hypothetical protein